MPRPKWDRFASLAIGRGLWRESPHGLVVIARPGAIFGPGPGPGVQGGQLLAPPRLRHNDHRTRDYIHYLHVKRLSQ